MSGKQPSKFNPLTSTIGLKVAMAVSGVLLALFVLQHMAGNLQVFLGREEYNEYAHFMQSLGELKWAARLGLLGLLALHVGSAVMLIQRNRDARPNAYQADRKNKASSAAGRSMALSGFVILFFVIYHLLHFTVGVVHADCFGMVDPHGHHDVYNNFVHSLSNPLIGGAYIVANVFVALHLSHSLTSIFQTLGLMEGRFREQMRLVGPVFGAIILIGNVTMPLACMTGVLQADPQGQDCRISTPAAPAAEAEAGH